ncbi:hypothetical protein [Paludisphaera rhizosphaerae]|uniref:hypothetical protein n=1 Tax=Paludisphaera rhizosphaerae TaxID=2711216 RepID=UPI0013EA6C80|nr:hypothetical protein [Paludisphaera rhizosphaerae]
MPEEAPQVGAARPVVGHRHRLRRRPYRLIHLMAITAAVALTIGLPPTLVTVLKNPRGYWSPQDRATYIVVAALAFWTPVLALIAMARGRVELRRSARSYGGASVLAATAAMTLLCTRVFLATLAYEFHQLNWFGQIPGKKATLWPGWPLEKTLGALIFSHPDSYFSPLAWRVVAEGAEGIVAAIVAVWVVLALSGKGRRPVPLFDQCCFFVGLGWVLWLLWRDVAPPLPLF